MYFVCFVLNAALKVCCMLWVGMFKTPFSIKYTQLLLRTCLSKYHLSTRCPLKSGVVVWQDRVSFWQELAVGILNVILDHSRMVRKKSGFNILGSQEKFSGGGGWWWHSENNIKISLKTCKFDDLIIDLVWKWKLKKYRI